MIFFHPRIFLPSPSTFYPRHSTILDKLTTERNSTNSHLQTEENKYVLTKFFWISWSSAILYIYDMHFGTPYGYFLYRVIRMSFRRITACDQQEYSGFFLLVWLHTFALVMKNIVLIMSRTQRECQYYNGQFQLLTFDLDNKNEIPGKNLSKVVKSQKIYVENIALHCKFSHYCVTCGNCYHFQLKNMVAISTRNTKI